MFKTIIEAFKSKDLRKKLLITFGILLLYRVGCFIPLPGVDVDVFRVGVEGDTSLLYLMSSISGGALANGAILALGVGPYVNASIIVQLLSFVIPSWQQLSKQGDEGKKKLGLYTRIAALGMSIAQAIGIVLAFNKEGALYTEIFAGAWAWLTPVLVCLILVAGGMFTMWLGEKITENGVGNGLSLILFIGILSTAGTNIYDSIVGAVEGDLGYLWWLLAFILAVIVIFGLIVFIDSAERKIPVQYANQIRGRKMYGGQTTHIPMKINSAGVMPIIFTMAFVAFPQIIFSLFQSAGKWWQDAYEKYSEWMGAGGWIYIVITSILIFAFSFFYNQLMFNTDDVARNIQQNGGFITGIRPGRDTAQYLKRISNRMTLFGAIFLACLALIPSLVFKPITADSNLLVNAFSATGLLIVVSVALEFNKQLEAQLMMKQYRGLLK